MYMASFQIDRHVLLFTPKMVINKLIAFYDHMMPQIELTLLVFDIKQIS